MSAINPGRGTFLERRGSFLLLGLLIAVTIASPIADVHPRVGAVLAVIVLLAIGVGASLRGNKRTVLLIGLPLSMLWLLARLLEEFGSGHHVYNHLAHVFGFLLSCTLLWAISHRLRTTSEVTTNLLAEAFISYLIIATAFSQLYWILNELVSGAFNVPIPPTQGATFLYFSMITLTGVGYGELLPVNAYIRIVAALESMTGIFYVAVVVARLVSSYPRREVERMPPHPPGYHAG